MWSRMLTNFSECGVRFLRPPMICKMRCAATMEPPLEKSRKVMERVLPSSADSTVYIENMSDCKVVIGHTDPHESPSNDSLLVFLSEPATTVSNNNEPQSLLMGHYETGSGAKHVLLLQEGSQGGGSHALTCFVLLPINCSVVSSSSGKGAVALTDVQAASIRVDTYTGDIHTQNLRADEIVLSTEGGNVVSRGVLQAASRINTTSLGAVSCQRLQGSSCSISTEKGDVDVASSYCDLAFFRTVSGSLQLRNLHRQANIHVTGSGHVAVSGLDGSLQALIADGDVDMQVSRLEADSMLHTRRGNVTLRLAGHDSCPMILTGRTVNLDDSLEATKPLVHTSEVGQVIVTAPDQRLTPCFRVHSDQGNIKVLKADWLSTLKLKVLPT